MHPPEEVNTCRYQLSITEESMLLQQTTSKVAGDAHLFPVSEYETPTLSASVATSSSKQHLTGYYILTSLLYSQALVVTHR